MLLSATYRATPSDSEPGHRTSARQRSGAEAHAWGGAGERPSLTGSMPPAHVHSSYSLVVRTCAFCFHERPSSYPVHGASEAMAMKPHPHASQWASSTVRKMNLASESSANEIDTWSCHRRRMRARCVEMRGDAGRCGEIWGGVSYLPPSEDACESDDAQQLGEADDAEELDERRGGAGAPALRDGDDAHEQVEWDRGEDVEGQPAAHVVPGDAPPVEDDETALLDRALVRHEEGDGDVCEEDRAASARWRRASQERRGRVHRCKQREGQVLKVRVRLVVEERCGVRGVFEALRSRTR